MQKAKVYIKVAYLILSITLSLLTSGLVNIITNRIQPDSIDTIEVLVFLLISVAALIAIAIASLYFDYSDQLQLSKRQIVPQTKSLSFQTSNLRLYKVYTRFLETTDYLRKSSFQDRLMMAVNSPNIFSSWNPLYWFAFINWILEQPWSMSCVFSLSFTGNETSNMILEKVEKIQSDNIRIVVPENISKTQYKKLDDRLKLLLNARNQAFIIEKLSFSEDTHKSQFLFGSLGKWLPEQFVWAVGFRLVRATLLLPLMIDVIWTAFRLGNKEILPVWHRNIVENWLYENWSLVSAAAFISVWFLPVLIGLLWNWNAKWGEKRDEHRSWMICITLASAGVMFSIISNPLATAVGGWGYLTTSLSFSSSLILALGFFTFFIDTKFFENLVGVIIICVLCVLIGSMLLQGRFLITGLCIVLCFFTASLLNRIYKNQHNQSSSLLKIVPVRITLFIIVVSYTASILMMILRG